MNLTPVDFKAVAAKGCFVYCYLREDGSPYYIGIASDPRRPVHWDHSCAVPTDRSFVRVLKSGLTVDEVREYEKFYIARYKRIKDGGILENKALGGQGAYGAEWSQETIDSVMEGRHGDRWEAEAAQYGVPFEDWKTMGATERKLVKHFFATKLTATYNDYLAMRSNNAIQRGRKAGECTGVANSRLVRAAAKHNVPIEWWASLTQKQRDYFPRWVKKDASRTYQQFAAA